MPLHPDESSEARLRRRIETQGYRGLTDAELRALAPWMRFTPLANALLVAVGALADSAEVLAAGALLMLWGAVTSRHPFDAFYNHVISTLEGTPLLPHCPRRRLTYALAAGFMAATAWLLHAGHRGWSFGLAGLMIAIFGLLAFTQIFVASEIVERVERRPRDEIHPP
jgi:hypothetical protein